MDPSYYLRCLKPERCASCEREQPESRCGSCKVTRYCSSGCQKNHWPKHRKVCKQKKAVRDVIIQDGDDVKNDGTDLFIIATQLAMGDIGDPPIRDLRYAMELYKKAAITTKPFEDGHPIAMLHLAMHYERGFGVQKDVAVACQWHQNVLDHSSPGEEALQASLMALSKYYREGLGGLGKSEEMAAKYMAFSQSNPESRAELQGLENWWANGGREAVLEATRK